MAQLPEKPASPEPLSPARVWAEQLAMGMALVMAVLIFMALFHPKLLAVGGQVLGPNYMGAYGWMSALGVFLHLVLHEGGTLAMAWWLKLKLRFRLFAFGANATAILENQPRRVLIDAVVGFAGPLIGTILSLGLAVIYHVTYDADSLHSYGPFLLGMACVGYFYTLFTLIPILDLEGGWISAAIPPHAWLLGLVAGVVELTSGFNLVLLCVVCFGLPRLILVIRGRAPRTDLGCTPRQSLGISLLYFALVLALAWLGTATFEELTRLVPEAMGD